MNREARSGIAAAFARADDYDRHAGVQASVARRLAGDIARQRPGGAPRVLEVGCGTGFLTAALADQGLGGEWLVTDIAAEMVERCRRRMAGRENLRFAVLDGERGVPAGAGRYDLVCSSLALQWFDDPARAAERMIDWLAPGGHLMFTTLAQGTFAEWRTAHLAEGLAPGLRRLPAAAAWSAVLQGLQARPPRIDIFRARARNGLDFLRALKAIGAATPDPAHRPLGPAALRRVLRRFEARGAEVSYEVVTCHYRRPE